MTQTVSTQTVPRPVPTASRAPASVEQSLSEVLAQVMGIEQVPSDAHFFDDLGGDSMLMARFCARVRRREDLPSVSIKDVYQHPTVTSLATALAPRPDPLEETLADVLAEVVGAEQVPRDAHFFDDLGADSMLMARFCARVRKRDDLPSVSIKDVYQHPTVTRLATALAPASPAAATAPPPADATGVPVPSVQTAPPIGTPHYVLCGTLQLLIFLVYSLLAGLIVTRCYEYVFAATGPVEVYLRTVEFGTAGFVTISVLPILAKWTLMGRWKEQQIRVWSLPYLRFWVVKTLVRASPMALFAGSPLYSLYLRALGARIGRGTVILSRHVPVCTDLLTVGDGALVCKDSFFSGYHAHAGVIRTGRVTIGRDAVVGEMTVLDINTALGTGAQLGHSSSLHAGTAVPDGEHRHGSPAQKTDVDYRRVEPTMCGAPRRITYAVLQLLTLLLLYIPLSIGGVALLFSAAPGLEVLLRAEPLALTSPAFYVDAVVLSLVLFFGSAFLGIVVVVVVPRLLARVIEPGRVYKLYGIRWSAHRTIARLTNSKFYMQLFGDSSYIVHYLRVLGYDLSRIEQTGSNFGSLVKHETPYAVHVGSGTMVADGLSVLDAEFSTTSFRVSPVSIGPRNFLGNNVAYPPGGRTGANCLLATKVMVPLDGPVREGVGLLGSPCFEIPRTVDRDARFDHLRSGDELRRGLRAKNAHNLRTMGLFLLQRWVHVLGLTLLAMASADLYHSWGAAAFALFSVLALVFSIIYFSLTERAVMGFRSLSPRYCSIYDPYFWRHERYWKLMTPPAVTMMLAGTPFKNVVTRLQGVRIGRRVFDDGCGFIEKSLVTVGDGCTLNLASTVQSHSQEDGAFKSDHSTVGAGCTLGVGALVHYGVTLGEGAELEPDSFLMKGEEVAPQQRWGGNPAREMPAARSVAPRSHENPATDLVPPQPRDDMPARLRSAR